MECVVCAAADLASTLITYVWTSCRVVGTHEEKGWKAAGKLVVAVGFLSNLGILFLQIF